MRFTAILPAFTFVRKLLRSLHFLSSQIKPDRCLEESDKYVVARFCRRLQCSSDGLRIDRELALAGTQVPLYAVVVHREM